MISSQTRRLYDRFRKAGSMRVGFAAADALSSARTLRKWQALERLGAVRLRVEEDIDFDPSDFEDPQWYAGRTAYGVVGEYRTDWDNRGSWHLDDGDHESVWVHADSVWGNVGYQDPADPAENECTLDVMAETIDAFRAAWQAHVAESARPECPTCHGTGRI
jgi:hypothetical protein